MPKFIIILHIEKKKNWGVTPKVNKKATILVVDSVSAITRDNLK